MDAATKVRPVTHRSSADITESYIWIQHKIWLHYRIKDQAVTVGYCKCADFVNNKMFLFEMHVISSCSNSCIQYCMYCTVQY